MKLSKTSLSLVAIAALLALAPGSQAQSTTNAPGGRRAGMRGVEAQVTALNEHLKLTDEQKPKIKTLLEEQNKKITELRGDSAVSQEDRRAKMQAIRADTSKKMKEVLTADQFKKYEEFLKERRNNRGPGGRAGGAGAEGTNAPKPKQ